MGIILTILWRLIVRGQMLAIGYNLSFAVTNLSFTAINQGFVKGEELCWSENFFGSQMKGNKTFYTIVLLL